MAAAGIWKVRHFTAAGNGRYLWYLRAMATKVALAFDLTCVRLYLDGFNHSLNLVYHHSLVLSDQSDRADRGQPTDGGFC